MLSATFARRHMSEHPKSTQESAIGRNICMTRGGSALPFSLNKSNCLSFIGKMLLRNYFQACLEIKIIKCCRKD